MIGWAGAVMQLIGRFRLGHRNRDAFLWSIIGKALWIVWSVNITAYPVTVIAVSSMLLDARAWYIWGKKR